MQVLLHVLEHRGAPAVNTSAFYMQMRWEFFSYYYYYYLFLP